MLYEIIKEKGSTIITLLKDYVNTFNVGKHTLKITYTDNQIVEITFTIAEEKKEKDETPKTGDTSCMTIYKLLIMQVIGS